MARTLALLIALFGCFGSAAASPAAAQVATPRPAATPARKPDLADAVEGIYEGDVISDSRGSSRSGVTVTVKRTGKNLVEVSSDYARLPTVSIPLTQAMTSIIAARGDAVLVMDRAKDARRLDLTIDGASLVVRRD